MLEINPDCILVLINEFILNIIMWV